MESSAQPRSRLQQLDLLDLDQTVDLGAALGSPLSLLSPNAPRTRPSTSPVMKPGNLGPRFGKRRPDPRRQSSAIFAGFAQATAGAGLLDEDEISVAPMGDEDILVSLPVAAKSQAAGATGHSTLWLEPHMEELLGGDLPEPDFLGGGPAVLPSLPEPDFLCSGLGGGGGGLMTIPESPTHSQNAEEPVHCSSPMPTVSPYRRGATWAGGRVGMGSPSPRRALPRGANPAKGLSRGASPYKSVGGVRDSTVLAEGLSKMCLEVGFDDWDSGDFQLQDGNKVKEMAFLFKMESDAQAASSPPQPAESAASPRPADMPAGCVPVVAPTEAASSGAAASRVARSVAEPVPGKPSLQSPAAKPRPPDSSRPSAAAPASRAAGGAASRLQPAPAPAIRPSRLRPPSTSSSYFSHSVTDSRSGGPAAQQQQKQRSAPAAKPTVAPVTSARAASVQTRAGSGLRLLGTTANRGPAVGASAAPTRDGAAVASSPPLAAASGRQSLLSSPLCSAAAALGRAVTASKLATTSMAVSSGAAAGRSRLAQPGSAQAATPQRTAAGSTKQPAAAIAPAPAADQPRRGMFSQRTIGAAASRLRPPTAHTCDTPTMPTISEAVGSTVSAIKPPRLQLGSPAVSPNGDNHTPNTARIRFLEQHPELAFGGGSKVGNSPVGQEQEEQVRRKTAAERHLEEWADHL